MGDTAYIDQNCLITLTRKAATSQLDSMLRDLQGAGVHLALSPTHWFEASRAASLSEALRVADVMDSLGALWLRERRDMQRREVVAWLAGRPGDHELIEPICRTGSEVVAGLPSLRGRYPIVTSAKIVTAFVRDKQVPNSLEESYRRNAGNFLENVKSVKEGKLTRRKEQDLWLAYLGSVASEIGGSSPHELSKAARASFPTVFAEFEIAKEHWSRGTTNPDMKLSPQRLSDVFHIVIALPYVDYLITEDKRLRSLIRSVCRRFPFPTAKTYKSLDELLAEK